jgi:hypothetical protein
MDASEIILILTVVVGFVMHLKNVIPSWIVCRRLERAIGQNSPDPIVGTKGWQFLMFINPNVIFNESDSSEVRALKQEFVDTWKSSLRSHSVVIRVILTGFALSIVVHVLGLFLKGKP